MHRRAHSPPRATHTDKRPLARNRFCKARTSSQTVLGLLSAQSQKEGMLVGAQRACLLLLLTLPNFTQLYLRQVALGYSLVVNKLQFRNVFELKQTETFRKW